MKKLSLILVLSLSPLFANALDSRICTSISKTHIFTVQEVADGVQGTFEQIAIAKWGTIGRAPAYKVSGKLTSTLVVHGVTLADALNNRNPLTEMLVSMMMPRPEFDGEADMLYAYANDYRQKLACK